MVITILEAIFEFIFEFILEGGVTIGANKKYSKWIRYPLLILTLLLYVGIIAMMVSTGFEFLDDELWRAIAMWLIALAFVILSIVGVHAEFKRYKKREASHHKVAKKSKKSNGTQRD